MPAIASLKSIDALWRRRHPRTHVNKHGRLGLSCQALAREGGVEESINTLLNSFWTVRGVHAAEDRSKLIELAVSQDALPAVDEAMREGALDGALEGQLLPGLQTLWELDMDALPSRLAVAKVAQVSRRLVQLSQVLGTQGDIDVVFMVVREPQLLTAELSAITERLVQLRIALAGRMDVSRLVERQPSLLLSRTDISQQCVDAAVQCWLHGLPSDTREEWLAHLESLRAYRRLHGDAHVGFRDSDDAQLKRWCCLQRSSFAKGTLTSDQVEMLRDVGFEFEDEEAEWQKNFSDLKRFKLRTGHIDSSTFTATSEFYLTNWCSVQRIARRSSVLRRERVALLDNLAFDWTGADPLS